jgi:hypothetical protein
MIYLYAFLETKSGNNGINGVPSAGSSGSSRPDVKEKLWIDTDVAGLDYDTLEEGDDDIFTEVAVRLFLLVIIVILETNHHEKYYNDNRNNWI